MNSVPSKPNAYRSAAGILVAFGLLGGLLLAVGRKDYPDLHILLDTGMFLLSGLLAMLFWQIAVRDSNPFPTSIAITFTLTSLSELVHALVGVEWSGRSVSIVQSQQVLPPATWPPGAYLLPIGVGVSLWMMHRRRQNATVFALFLIALTAGLFVLFHWLPLFSSVGRLGIDRPTLILVPFLCATIGWACWRMRSADRMLPMLACLAAVLFFANTAILYSSSPHDTLAMVAHMGKVAGYSMLLLSLMEMASFDMHQRIRAERELAELNEELEHRVVERTAQLDSANKALQAENAVRLETERARNKSQQLIQAVIDNSPAVTYVKDLEGHYLLVNRRYSELFHISNEEIAGKTDHDLFPKDVAEAVRSMDLRAVAAATAVTAEEMVPHDGMLHTYVSVKCPLSDETGKAYAVFGVSTDITERKHAEEARRASEERTRLIVETALDAAISIDAEGVITEWNPHAETVFGWTREKALGRPLAETIIPPNYRDAHRTGLKHYLATGQGPVLNKRIEITGLHYDGHEFPIELSITPIRTGDTTVFSAFVRDISERKQAEQVRERLAAIVESSDDAIISKTLDGTITAWNFGAEKLFGYSSSEAVGKSMMMLLPPERANEESEILTRIGRGERLDHFETVRVRKDGSRIDVSATISPIRDRQGAIIGASKIARDITERKRAEAKVHAQLERLNLLHQITRAIGGRQDLGSIYQAVLRSLEEHLTFDFGCICDYDAVSQQLTVLHVGVGSQPLARELVMSEHSHISIDANGLSRCVAGELVYEPDIAVVKMPFPQRLAAAGLRSLVVAPLLVESKVFGVVVTARRQPEGFSSGECEFLRQVSEHVALAAHQAELHAALQRAYNDLRETQQAVMQQERLRALGQMTSGVAHDINNAISPVTIYTELLLEDEPSLSERARRYLVTIQHAIGDVAQTVSRMREFYRQREPELTLVPVDLNQLVQQVMDMTRARWYDIPLQRGISIQAVTELSSGLPAIMGVDSEIREALVNLVFNAVDAMPSGGTVTLRTNVIENVSGATDGGSQLRQVKVEVADTGLGMDDETKRRCLEPFFTTKGERGTGLGLAMVYGVVQRHSAELEIESIVNQGTTVRLVFPTPAKVVGRSAPAAVTRGSLPRMRILVVDDDPVLLRSVCDTLENDGHAVTSANGGQEGINAFQLAHTNNKGFDVVITDLGMPHVDGSKVSSAIKALSSSTPVILLTGWGQRLVAEADVPSHVNYVLNKPPKLRELREALAKCCQPEIGPPGP